ncbi:hypothetical protein ABW21_db0205271 [Orbilia brochopaga]|nr:hypothetical protein ABW21_db0205271 [Drechslerella brochopaga]
MYSGNSYMTSTRASALSVLGISIDLADLAGRPEPARTLNKIPINAPLNFDQPNPLDDSLQSFLMSTSRHAPASVLQLNLPSREEAKMLVEWNWFATQPYLPIIHKPTFMAEFNRMYDVPGYKTSPAHLVITHMVLAMAMYHMAKRQVKVNDHAQPDRSRAFRHYHFSLTFLNLLLAGGTLEDCQALIYLVAFTRGFTRPGPAYLLSKITTATIFELRLHRSLKKECERTGTKLNVLEDEIRKRVFWIGISIDVGLSAKLNRPIGVLPSDYDAEKPARIEDEFITESGFTKPLLPDDEKCSFDVAFGLIKCAEFTIDVHTALYAAKRPTEEEYQPLVEGVEAKMTAWKDALPVWLRYDPKDPDLNLRMQSANLMLWYNEVRILLRHPSLNISTSPSFNSDNLTICVASSRAILEMCDLMRRENNLDLAWHAASVPLLACMTLLFAIWEKRETVTPSEIARVKSDMDLSVTVMKEYGAISCAVGKSTGLAVKRRASLSTKTFAPPVKPEPQTGQLVIQPQQQVPQQQAAISQLQQLDEHFDYSRSTPDIDHIAAAAAAASVVSPTADLTTVGSGITFVDNSNMSNMQHQQIDIANHGHVDLHANITGFPDPTSTGMSSHHTHRADQQQQQLQNQLHSAARQQQAQIQQHQQFYIPHTSAAETTYWYGAGAPGSWGRYLTQMSMTADGNNGFPTMALMALGQPRGGSGGGGGDVDAQWGFMNMGHYHDGGGG